ncbi:Permease of the major facilitator superfamily [Candidatus Burkholderia verschuerenii]|uniref:Permease of the major facilitator superfamily n=1 Tax=Candidatus Burkholderia verschuerenii TaxID=242163 RepID=A0A0L0MJH7_9BURK|nr:MFS transporter [Candidatus Burkholderia verschuerenii]KND62124.1 Permease of the major facilitator superfamily [Candidatus Burkholderia verschuerenii]
MLIQDSHAQGASDALHGRTALGSDNLRAVTLSSVLGAVIEWYDFFLYGVVAGVVLNRLYFPQTDAVVSTMLAYSTFALGFVARPVGGVIFGHFGDRLGRKKMLMLTLLLMGGATVTIGLVPTYASIGIAAPLLLLVCRIVQGIGLGGEWGGAVLMTYESAPADKRGFYASLSQIGMSLGLVLASGVVAVLSFTLDDAQFLAWGWRAAFIASGVLVIVTFYMRKHVAETDDFNKAKKTKRDTLPIADVFRKYPRTVLACMGARVIDGVFFNVFGVFSIHYFTETLHFPRTTALLGVVFGAAVMTFFIPFWGRVSDKIGQPLVYGMGALLAGLSAYPAFMLMHGSNGSAWPVWIAIIIPFGVFHAAVFGTMSSLFSEAFEPDVRYSGISFVYQFAGVFAGGLTPVAATWLTGIQGGKPWFLCAYVLAAGTISALSCVWLARHRKSPRCERLRARETNTVR